MDHHIRAVFWLIEAEAAALPWQSPDFWAFRHRVVEFVEPPTQAARRLVWQDWSDKTLRQDTEAKIALREALLADLPEGDETLAARAELHFTLGGLYWAAGRYTQAEEAYKTALGAAEQLEDKPLRTACYNGLGNVYRGLGRYQEAMAAYQKAIELDPQYAYPWNNLGAAYHALARHEEAMAAYQKAIELDSQYAYPWNGLGNVYSALGRYEEAIAAYQRAIELEPAAGVFHNNQGRLYLKLGRVNDTQREFAEQVRLHPDDALDAHVHLGVLARHRGDKEAGQQHFEQALAVWDTAWDRKIQSPADLLESKAIAQLCLSHPDEALETQRQALAFRRPGATFEFTLYELLAAAAEPLQGLDDMLTLLREATHEVAEPSVRPEPA